MNTKYVSWSDVETEAWKWKAPEGWNKISFRIHRRVIRMRPNKRI